MKNKLIVALDLKGYDRIINIVKMLNDSIIYYKVGAVNFTAYGYRLVKFLVEKRKKIFLDLKYHDIPNTVKEAVFEASSLGINMLTIHSIGGREMMNAALEGAKAFEDKTSKKAPLILGVSVLTSIDNESLKNDMFIHHTVGETVVRLAENMQTVGIRGIVASANEVPLIRKNFGDYFTIVTPGIRISNNRDDQKRITAPKDAMKVGCDFIVVGRPIYASSNPKKASKQILMDMEV